MDLGQKQLISRYCCHVRECLLAPLMHFSRSRRQRGLGRPILVLSWGSDPTLTPIFRQRAVKLGERFTQSNLSLVSIHENQASLDSRSDL